MLQQDPKIFNNFGICDKISYRGFLFWGRIKKGADVEKMPEFNKRLKLLSVAKRVQILPFFIFEVLKICFPVIIISCLLVFVLVILNIGFSLQFPVIPIICVIAIIAVAAVSYLILKGFPTKRIMGKIQELEKPN